jgi:hypothetical protein
MSYKRKIGDNHRLRKTYRATRNSSAKKKPRKTERPMTTALFMLRCVELGLNIADLDLLTIGSVNDMFNEKSRDSMEWKEQASQSDFDKF